MSKFILDVASEISPLLECSRDTSLPTIDVQVILGHIVDSISHFQSADYELDNLHVSLITGEYICTGPVSGFTKRQYPDDLYESPEENIFGLEHFINQAIVTGHKLKNTFKQMKIYVDDELPVEFNTLINNRTMILNTK